MVFSVYIVWYLFLAGAGSGAFAIAAVDDLLIRLDCRIGCKCMRQISQGGFIVGPCAVFISILFLVVDLGSPQNIYHVLFNTRFTVLAFGSWSLAIFCLAALMRMLLTSAIQDCLVTRGIALASELVAFVAALATMTYTGFYLSTIKAVPFFNTPALVVLFVVSAFSTGSALIILYGFFNQNRKGVMLGFGYVVGWDIVFIVAEIAALIAFCITAELGQPTAKESLDAMVFGRGAAYFWMGLIAVGIILPLNIDIIARRTRETMALAFSAGCVLVGGFCLRYTLVLCAIHAGLFFGV